MADSVDFSKTSTDKRLILALVVAKLSVQLMHCQPPADNEGTIAQCDE